MTLVNVQTIVMKHKVPNNNKYVAATILKESECGKRGKHN